MRDSQTTNTREPEVSQPASLTQQPVDQEKALDDISSPEDDPNNGASKPDQASDFPDGGLRAWLVAAGASSAFFCTMGYINTFGVFQAYYMFNQLPNESADNISWIGSIQSFLMFASGVAGGPLFDRYGAWIIRPAAVTYVFSIMMTSLCKQYWQFMLAQGILSGLSNGLVLYPSLAAVPQWFDKKRGAAMGLSIAGSSIGAVIFPIMLSKMLNDTDISFGWSVRISGFLMLPFMLFACVAIKARVPPRKTKFFVWTSFKNPLYDLLVGALFFTMIGMFVPLFLLPTYAITKGMDETLASYLVAILNGASFFGRVIPGILGDKFGRVNTLCSAGVSTAILVFCWPLTESNAAIIVFAVLFGFCSGAIVSGGSTALTVCVDHPSNVGSYLGMGMAMASFAALVGPPVSGELVDSYPTFDQVSYFAGAMTIAGAVLAIIAKAISPAGILSRF